VEVGAPPTRGKANERLIRVLAKAFGACRSDVAILRGQGRREKVVRVENCNPEEMRTRLKQALEEKR